MVISKKLNGVTIKRSEKGSALLPAVTHHREKNASWILRLTLRLVFLAPG